MVESADRLLFRQIEIETEGALRVGLTQRGGFFQPLMVAIGDLRPQLLFIGLRAVPRIGPALGDCGYCQAGRGCRSGSKGARSVQEAGGLKDFFIIEASGIALSALLTWVSYNAWRTGIIKGGYGKSTHRSEKPRQFALLLTVTSTCAALLTVVTIAGVYLAL